MAEKVTTMKLKLTVDLQCGKCYKKVKKLLCNFPQIRDQAYDEKQNIVTIKVVCCNPEKIRDKLCCKGACFIKSIEIVEPPKPKPPEPEKKKEPEKKTDSGKPNPEKAPVEILIGICCGPCYVGRPGGPCMCGYGGPPEHEKKKEPEKKREPENPNPGKPRMEIPIGVCCGPCSEGRPGGPCMYGYGVPPPCCDGCYGRPVYDSYGWGRPCYVSRCDQYFSEENASGCTIM